MEKTVSTECRFYKKEIPDEGDLTVIKVKDVGEHSITVELLEYGKIEGMITQAEYTKVRRSKFNKGILRAKKMQKQEVCYVIRVDKEKKFIDLSKKQINSEQAKICEENYEKAKKVQNLFFPLCTSLKMDMIELYELIVWPLETEEKTAYEVFQDAIFDFDAIIGPLNLPKNIETAFRKELSKKFTPPEVKIKATFEVSCFSRRGVEDIKEALSEGKKVTQDGLTLEVNLISSPLYVIQTLAKNKIKGIELVQKGLEAIQKAVEARNGRFKLEETPHVIGEKEKAWETFIKDKKDLIGDDREDNDEGMGDMEIIED